MQDKFELFDDLPQSIQSQVGEVLTTKDLVSFAKVSRKHEALFRPLTNIRKLLHYVVHS